MLKRQFLKGLLGLGTALPVATLGKTTLWATCRAGKTSPSPTCWTGVKK